MLKHPIDIYEKLTNESKIRETYKIIDIPFLDPTLLKSIIKDECSQESPKKEIFINSMVDYYLNHRDIEIYKKTDYLCNNEEQICICNTYAENFRKIVDGNNYKQGVKYISWFNT